MTDRILKMILLPHGEHSKKVLEIQVNIEGQDKTVRLDLDDILECALKDQVVAEALTGIHNVLGSIRCELTEIRKYMKPDSWDQKE